MDYKLTGARIAGAILFAWMPMGATVDAHEAPAPRVVDLKAADGITLKATFLRQERRGPACCCCTSATAREKFGTTWRDGWRRRE